MEETNAILVVDDSPEQIRFVSELLHPEGCRIYAASNCEDAWLILKNQPVSLILLDIVMPGTDGFTFCRQIKQDEELKDIPVIFATAYHDVENLRKGFEVGGCDYVVKPFIREELLERVKVRIQFSQVRIQLQQANAELDKFCYTLSHDVRAPLYVIDQLTEILEKEITKGNDKEAAEICSMLREKASRTASMANGLHRFSRALYEPLEYSSIDMDELVTEVYEELRLLEGERSISFEKEKLGTIRADRTLLRVVVLNILSNALKFTGKREKAVIRVFCEKEMHRMIYYFEDNGIGFDEKYKQELFGVFRRLHSEEYSGDGIGLATVKRIVERHHGEVSLHSQAGKGTVVKIVLPSAGQ